MRRWYETRATSLGRFWVGWTNQKSRRRRNKIEHMSDIRSAVAVPLGVFGGIYTTEELEQ